MGKKDIAFKFCLHYFFSDNSHSLNALTRNECEKEILLIFNEVASLLDLEIVLETEAYQEGGLKEFWKVFGKNSGQLTIIVGILAIFLSRFPVENKELIKLQIENLKLDNEKKRIELEKLQKAIKAEKIEKDLTEEAYKILSSNHKILSHRSKFYKNLQSLPKIQQVSYSQYDQNKNLLDDEKIVKKIDFPKFLIPTNKLEDVEDCNAIIEIAAPILNKINHKWKGIYNGELIAFQIRDKTFLNAILQKKVEFSFGTALKCVLVRTPRINDNGVVVFENNKVLTVLEVINNHAPQSISKITMKKSYKDKERAQPRLDF